MVERRIERRASVRFRATDFDARQLFVPGRSSTIKRGSKVPIRHFALEIDVSLRGTDERRTNPHLNDLRTGRRIERNERGNVLPLRLPHTSKQGIVVPNSERTRRAVEFDDEMIFPPRCSAIANKAVVARNSSGFDAH